MKLPSSDFIGSIMLLVIATFMLGIVVIGGDALSGKIENHKYYIWDSVLKHKEDGTRVYKEVSAGVFFYSLLHQSLAYLLILVFVILKLWEVIKSKVQLKRED